MLSYLKKFNELPAELKDKVSSQKAMAAIENLEKEYHLPLAALIMRVMVKEIALADLTSFLLKENLAEAAAARLAGELKEKIFFSLGDYLSPPRPLSARPAEAPMKRIERSVQASPRPESAPAPAAVKQPAPPRPPVKAASGTGDRPLVKSAGFFFSADDEQEVKELAKKIGLAEKTELSAEKIETRLKTIINRAQINFGSADLADRFKEILRTYLRGIRNRLETELAFTKPFLSGGLSFDQDSARKVMALAGKVLNSESGSAGDQAGESAKFFPKINIPGLADSRGDGRNKPAVVRDAPYDFSKLAKAEKAPEPVQPGAAAGQPPKIAADEKTAARVKPEFRPRAGAIKPELAPLTPAIRPAEPAPAPAKPKFSASAPREKKPLESRAENKAFAPDRGVSMPAGAASPVSPSASRGEPERGERANETSQMPLIRRRFEAENLNRSQKVKVEDVKFIPRVMGPLDEIKYLDLTNFRRLDKDPSLAAGKIKGKIDLLEEEGYGKKLEAVKLWRSSPINRLYLEIGYLSIGENKPIDVIIEERKIAGRDYLNADEFKAIMDLNKSLRF